MTKRTAVVFSCAHADPQTPNDRFSWLGNFLYDIKPDYVVDLGDGADMRSLNTYDTRYPTGFNAPSYEKDIDCYNDAQERLRHRFKYAKKKVPYWIGMEGNHEHRIKRAIQHDPRLSGGKYGISFGHLQTSSWFNEYHEYEHSAPSIARYDGVDYAHFFTSGNTVNAVSGLHHANTLINNRHSSATCGHSHKRDIKFVDGASPYPLVGLVAGCYKGGPEHWAGQSNKGWWKGVVVKRELENGYYEPEFVSKEILEREYGS